MLESPENTTVHLHVSYVVTHASWMPRYDLRVFSKDRKMEVWSMIKSPSKQCVAQANS